MKKAPKPSFSSPKFIDQLRKLDHKAIELCVRTYTEHLVKASLGLGFNEIEACELAQNVWQTFYDVLPNFKGQSHIRTFLFGILYNKAKELRREKQKFSDYDPIDEVFEEQFDENGHWTHPISSPEKFMIASQTIDVIEKCIDALPFTQRMAFCMKELENQVTCEICKILEVTSTNLGVLLFRAKNKLRECIETNIEVD